jgi:hypothetical protein
MDYRGPDFLGIARFGSPLPPPSRPSVSSTGDILEDWEREPTGEWVAQVLMYVEYRAVSGVFQNIDPPPPLHPASVSSPRTKGGGEGGVHTRRAVREWGVNILEDARHWIGLLQYNLSTVSGYGRRKGAISYDGEKACSFTMY